MARYPDVWVMLNPAAAYAQLARLPITGGAWLMLKRPWTLAFVFGCVASLMASGRLTLRLLGPATVYWSFAPLLEIGSIALLSRNKRRSLPLADAIDLFFMSHGPWLLWLIGFAAMWAFVPARQVLAWAPREQVWFSSAFLAMVWSGYIDYWYFRRVLERTPSGAVRDLLLQRLICWIPALLIFLASSAWPLIATRFGL